jgi:hypothetical protein
MLKTSVSSEKIGKRIGKIGAPPPLVEAIVSAKALLDSTDTRDELIELLPGDGRVGDR